MQEDPVLSHLIPKLGCYWGRSHLHSLLSGLFLFLPKAKGIRGQLPVTEVASRPPWAEAHSVEEERERQQGQPTGAPL